MRAAIGTAMGIGLLWLGGQALAAVEGADAPAPDAQKAQLEKQLATVKAAKAARLKAMLAEGDLARLKKANEDAEDALEKMLAANPEFTAMEATRSKAKKAFRKAQEDQEGEGALSVAKRALDDAAAARDTYLEKHPEIVAAEKAADEADTVYKDAVSKAKDGDAEYTALRQKEADLDRKLEALDKQSGAAPEAE